MDTVPARALLEACRQRDEAAWRELVRRHERLIYYIPLRVYRLPPEDAAEVAQSVLCALLEQIDRIEKPESIPGWLAATARNISRDRIRQRDRERSVADPPENRLRDLAIQERLEQTLLMEMVYLALQELDPVCRRILAGRYFTTPPITYTQLARETGLAVGSIGPKRADCLECLVAIVKERLENDPEGTFHGIELP